MSFKEAQRGLVYKGILYIPLKETKHGYLGPNLLEEYVWNECKLSADENRKYKQSTELLVIRRY
jgi:hypothetical protein